MPEILTAKDELQELMSRSAALFAEALLEFAEEITADIPDVRKRRDRFRDVAEIVAKTKAVADLLGRKRMLMEVDERKRRYGLAPRPMRFAVEIPKLVPEVTFEEAVQDIALREPRLAETAAEVSELYSTEHGFAMARSAELSLTDRIRKLITKFIREGRPLPRAEKVIAEIGGWTRAYAETVFRTNVSTAYASGRRQQAADPELEDFIVGLRRVAVLDADVRPNHRAAHGVVARRDDPIWLRLGVPAGYNCRCSWELVDRIQARRNGWLDPRTETLPPARVPPGAFNDPGFESRMGFDVYGGF